MKKGCTGRKGIGGWRLSLMELYAVWIQAIQTRKTFPFKYRLEFKVYGVVPRGRGSGAGGSR